MGLRKYFIEMIPNLIATFPNLIEMFPNLIEIFPNLIEMFPNLIDIFPKPPTFVVAAPVFIEKIGSKIHPPSVVDKIIQLAAAVPTISPFGVSCS